MKYLVLASLFALTSCAGMQYELMGRQNEVPAQYHVSQTEEGVGGKVRIQYESFEMIEAGFKTKIQNEMLPEAQAKKVLAEIPKGGRFIVHIMRPSVETGNTKWFTYVLKLNDKEIARVKGHAGIDSVPDMPHRYGVDGGWWNNLEVINVDQVIGQNDSLNLFVIDGLSNSRDEFKLTLKPLPATSRSAASTTK